MPPAGGSRSHAGLAVGCLLWISLAAAEQFSAAGTPLSPAVPSQPPPATLAHPGPAQNQGDCPVATTSAPVASEPPLLTAPSAADQSAAGTALSRSPQDRALPAEDYRHQLASTRFGWPRLQRWCLWIEPFSGSEAALIWEQRWQAAVARALAQWQSLLPIQIVQDPQAAQVRILRRRPPLFTSADGRLRASHGRASLQLLRVNRAGLERLEPAVEVLLSPAQREAAIEATALHELGHAFGLWGHSDDAEDAMAAVPGPEPVLQLSRRDRATLRWLYSQPTRFGEPTTPEADEPHRSRVLSSGSARCGRSPC